MLGCDVYVVWGVFWILLLGGLVGFVGCLLCFTVVCLLVVRYCFGGGILLLVCCRLVVWWFLSGNFVVCSYAVVVFGWYGCLWLFVLWVGCCCLW